LAARGSFYVCCDGLLTTPVTLPSPKYNKIKDKLSARVRCYQLEGPAPNPGWRFFDLTQLEIIEPGPPPSDWVTPGNYKSKWQNAVQKPKHKV
jgi:hypothetical protein